MKERGDNRRVAGYESVMVGRGEGGHILTTVSQRTPVAPSPLDSSGHTKVDEATQAGRDTGPRTHTAVPASAGTRVETTPATATHALLAKADKAGNACTSTREQGGRWWG